METDMARKANLKRERGSRQGVAEGALKVLILGGEEALIKSADILDSLESMGFNLAPAKIVRVDTATTQDRPGNAPGCGVSEDYGQLIHQDPPDLIILTTHDHLLRKSLGNMVPPHTRILESFAVDVLHALKSVSGQLGYCKSRLESVEVIKEVLMAGTEVSIMVVDEDYKVLDINRAILDRTEMSREECLGRGCHWVLYRQMQPCYLKGKKCEVRDVLRTGHSTHTVREDTRRDGSKRYFTVSGYPLKGEEMGKKSVLIVWKDVTKGMTSVLDRQADTIRRDFLHFVHQDKMVALGKLAAAAVHEINNPIQGILVFSKMMRAVLDGGELTHDDAENFCRYLDLIADESARCGKIVRNLLSFSRQTDMEKSYFDIRAVMDEIFLLMGNRMELQNIALKSSIPDNLPPVFGDRNQIKQAILNLVLNAVEAMPDGGRLKVVTEVEPGDSHVTIRVSDTGSGVPKKMQKSIFEPFVTTKKDGKGVGLGLSVVYGVIAQHAGVIDVESGQGKGTTFTVKLPISSEPESASESCGS
jgi:PAS domain S-box-containing protein